MTRNSWLRRMPACSRPVLAVLALAAALLWLLPVDALAQDEAVGPKITAGPAIASSPQSGGVYRAGEAITVTLTFSEPVTVTKKPRLRLKIGDKKRWAGYDSTGADGATLSFTHAVKADDVDADGVSIGRNQLKLKGGTIADADGNAANLKHPALPDQAGHQVNGAPDESQQPTNSEPQFTDDTAARSVEENTAAGENVGAAVTAEDDDNDTLTYALTGADAGSFDFDTASGQLTVKDALDYEAKASYTLTVTVHDGKDTAGETDAGEDDTIRVTVSVGNVEEAGTVALDPNTPQVGSALTATVSDPDGGVTGLAWAWERSVDGNAWAAIAGATAAAYTPTNDDADHYLQATARYDDGEGTGKSAHAATAGTVAAAKPSFQEGETATRSVPENTPKGVRVGAAIAATALNEGDTLTYALAGADAAAFRIDESTGQLRFVKAPDFERPADKASATPANAAANNQYVVSVTVTDGKDSGGNAETVPVVDDTITVTISVANVDERGRLVLSTTRPSVGSAVAATVSDPDGPTSPTWKWERSSGRKTWSVISGAASASHTPTAADAGRFLRVTATYNDSLGNGRQAETQTTEVVVGPTLSKLEIATTSNKKMYPAFDAATLHYAVGCQVAPAMEGDDPTDAALTIKLAAANATRVSVNGKQHSSSEHTLTLAPGATGEVRITTSDSTGAATTYVVHCLDNNIPEITTTKTPGATGIIEELMIFSESPSVMVIDNNGVPRWYTDADGAGPFFRYFELKDGSRRYFYSLPQSNPDPAGSVWYELDDDFYHADLITTVGDLVNTDTHDIILTKDGKHYVVLAYEPARRDFSSLTATYGVKKKPASSSGRTVALFKGDTDYASGVGLANNEDTLDSVIQVRTPNQEPKNENKKGTEAWIWNSWGYIPLADCVQNPTPRIFPSGYAHLNSVELLPDGDFIASFRGCSTVLRIDRATGDVVWRLGRTNLSDAEWKTLDDAGNGQGQAPMKILDDPYGEFCGQHAAYLLENGNLFVFDNGVGCLVDPHTGDSVRKDNVFSRIVEYAIDPEHGEAVFQRHHSLHDTFDYVAYFSGHVEELDNGDWLVSWGGISEDLRTRFNLPDTAKTPDHSTTQVDPDTKLEKFSITIGDPPNSIEDIRAIPLSPVALAAEVLPLTATTISNASSSTHSGASDSPRVVVAFNQSVVDIARTTSSVVVTGATVESVAPYFEAGIRANAYVFTLKPTGNGDITFKLRARESCASATKGICTAAGGRLSKKLSRAHTIAYSATPKVTLELTPSSIDESGTSNSATVTATLNQAVSGATTVTVSAAAGTAGASEFTLSPNRTLTIAANAITSAGVVTITAVDDSVDEDDETVVVSGAVTTGTPDDPDDVTLTINDDDGLADTAAPTVSSVAITSSPAAHDSYAPGETITMEVTFSEPVKVTGAPCLLINVGELRRPAAYASGSGSNKLRFSYTVVTGDRDKLGVGAYSFGSASWPLRLSCTEGAAGTIRDDADNDADLSLRLLWGDAKHKVGGPDVIADRTPPTITGLAVVSSPESGDTYRDGETIQVQVTFSEPVVAVSSPRMAIWIGNVRRELAYREGTSTDKLTFGYEVRWEDRDNQGISVRSTRLPVHEKPDWPSITDSADNFANVEHELMDDQAGHKVAGSKSDATAPTVERVGMFSAPGPYVPGQEILIRAILSEPVQVSGTPYLELSVGGEQRTAAYRRPNEDTGRLDVYSSVLPFYYTVTVEDANPLAIGADSMKLPAGASIRDWSTNDAVLTHDLVGELPRYRIFRTHVVDGGVSITSSPADGDTYRAGETIRVSVRFNRKVTVTGVPALAVRMDPGREGDPAARYSGGSGTDTLTFDHVVVSGDRDRDGIEIDYRWYSRIALGDSGSIKDEDSNDALLENDRVAVQTGHKVDGGG